MVPFSIILAFIFGATWKKRKKNHKRTVGTDGSLQQEDGKTQLVCTDSLASGYNFNCQLLTKR